MSISPFPGTLTAPAIVRYRRNPAKKLDAGLSAIVRWIVAHHRQGAEIRGNYIYDLRRSANGDPSSMIYLDEGSSGFLVRDNLTETNVFFRNRNGEGNHWENTGTAGPHELKAPPGTQGAAGLEAAFLDLSE